MRPPLRLQLARGLALSAATVLLAAFALGLLSCPEPSFAQGLPGISFNIESSDEPEDVALSLQILFFFTILSIAPGIFIMIPGHNGNKIPVCRVELPCQLLQVPCLYGSSRESL